MLVTNIFQRDAIATTIILANKDKVVFYIDLSSMRNMELDNRISLLYII